MTQSHQDSSDELTMKDEGAMGESTTKNDDSSHPSLLQTQDKMTKDWEKLKTLWQQAEQLLKDFDQQATETVIKDQKTK
ncbi:hypothetical protein ACXZ1M_24300 [Duganella sp. PWIR1]